MILYPNSHRWESRGGLACFYRNFTGRLETFPLILQKWSGHQNLPLWIANHMWCSNTVMWCWVFFFYTFCNCWLYNYVFSMSLMRIRRSILFFHAVQLQNFISVIDSPVEALSFVIGVFFRFLFNTPDFLGTTRIF